jgi:hypothetical protein
MAAKSSRAYNLASQARSLAFATASIGLLLTIATQAQTVSTWSGGAGNWSDCPPSGNALWDTCPDPPNGLGWPNGNFDAVINGGPVTATSASIVNLTVGTGGSLSFAASTTGILTVTGTSILNNGVIAVDSADGLSVQGPSSLTISGSGTITIGNNSSFNGISTPTVTNQQTIEGNGNFALAMNLVNQGMIIATGGTLNLQPSSVTNISTMEASSGATLALNTGFPVTYSNTGGTIQALSGGIVQMNGTIVSGGTITTAGTGTIQANSNAVLNALTNNGSVVVSNAELEGTVTNKGTIQVPSATLSMTGPVTLTGSGSVIMSGTSNLNTAGGNTDALKNDQLIHGSGTFYQLPLTNQGTVSADSSGNTLLINGGTTTNTATMKATGGGILQFGTVVNNTGGTIEALNGSTVILTNSFNGSLNGGTLTTSGTGVIESQNALLDGTVNVPTNAGQLQVNNFDLYLQGTINNTGTINLIGNSCIFLNQPTTLTGSGKLTMVSTSCIDGGGIAFTNKSTIQGAGNVGDSNPMPITNAGTITANNIASPLTINSGTYGFTNNGKLIANAGSTLTIAGSFTNLSTTGALLGGTYSESGVLGMPGAIVTNGASITLTGATGEILNTATGTNALAGLTSNTSAATLSVQSGQVLTTNTKLSNAGKVIVGAVSSFTVGGSYTQTGGTTTVDGTLTTSGAMSLQRGSLVGKGTVAAAVSSSAAVTAGDSSTKPGKLSISGSYTQQSKGILNVSVGGTAAGTFGDLAVTNGVQLAGTLNISLISGFVPAIGDSFTILSGSAVSGTFGTVNGTSINSSEHFQVNYSSNAVTLTVVAGP